MDINKLWRSQSVPPADWGSFKIRLDKYKLERKKKMLWTFLSLGFTAVFIIVLMTYIQPERWSTRIGIVLILGAIIMVITSTIGLWKMYVDLGENNRVVLHRFKAIKLKEEKMHTTVMQLYFLFLSTGLVLYMWEYVVLLGWIKGGIAYVITAIWIAINWWVFRPRLIKKARREWEQWMNDAERLEQQWN
jgi:hypothetical protein